MGNVASQAGQLMRPGVRVLKKKIVPRRVQTSVKKLSSYTREAFRESEAGQSSISKQGKVRVYLVTLIEEGLGNSKDKNYYSGEALQKAAPLFEGSKCFADHPSAITEQVLPERSVKEIVGWYTSVQADKGPDGRIRLRGKLHIFPGRDWLTSMIDTILTNPDADSKFFGISINAVGRTKPAEMGGEEVNLVEEFQRVDSADIVTEPAARGSFDQILESRRNSVVKKSVTTTGKIREAMTFPRMKELGEQAIQAYSSDNPDEMKAVLAEIGPELLAQSSLTGKGPGEANEDSYTNTQPGGFTTMPKNFQAASSRRTKASTGNQGGKNKVAEAKAGVIEEAEEEVTEAGSGFEDFGNQAPSSNQGNFPPKRPAKRPPQPVQADDTEEAAFDSTMASAGDGVDGVGVSDFPDDGMGNDMTGEGCDLDDPDALVMGEAEEEPEPDEEEMAAMESFRQGFRAQREARRGKEARGNREAQGIRGRTRETSAGDFGKTDIFPEVVGSHSVTQPSSKPAKGTYTLKTSTGGNSHVARVVTEANRRIEMLATELDGERERNRRLRESRDSIQRTSARQSRILAHHQSIRNANALLREAVDKQMLPENLALSKEFRESLHGLPRDKQRMEILRQARIYESLDTTFSAKFQENGDGGVRGFFASNGPSTEENNSPLEATLAELGIPMESE